MIDEPGSSRRCIGGGTLQQLRWGPDVDILIEEKDQRIAGLIEERDTIKKRADALTNVVEQAVEVAVRLASR